VQPALKRLNDGLEHCSIILIAFRHRQNLSIMAVDDRWMSQ